MTDAEIEELVRQFEACTWPYAKWKHAPHLTIALYYLRRHPRDIATQKMLSGIGLYNKTVVPNAPLCHQSLTRSWMAIIHHFMKANDRKQSDAELTRLLIGKLCKDPMLSEYYSKTVMDSKEALRGWVPPDLKTLP